MDNIIQRSRKLRRLQKDILASDACPRLIKYCHRVAKKKRAMYRDQKYWGKALPSFGDPEAELLIIGLAPAAHGGNRTGRMFTGDRSGDFLFRALHEAGFANQPASVHRNDGLRLKNCYVTTVVRWAPPQNRPTSEEVRRCLPFLQRELGLLDRVKIVLVLGRLAYDAFLRLARQQAELPPKARIPFRHGAAYELPSPLPRLHCSYHPSQHNTQTGRLTQAMFQRVLRDIQRSLSRDTRWTVESTRRSPGSGRRGHSMRPKAISTNSRAPKAAYPGRKGASSQTAAIMALGGYTSSRRMRRIFNCLDRRFAHAACALRYGNAFELLVATILSAQCTDNRVNMTTPELFRKYPTVEAFAALQPEVLEQDIYSTGFFRSKARNLIATSKKIVDEFGGQVPQRMEELLTLSGVARKTANVVLGTAYGIASGIVVDTHVFRVATRRLKLSRGKTPELVERDLLKIVPRGRWIRFSYQLTLFGREICLARKPRCADCSLEPICDSPEKTA
jgi:endonuclease III